MPDARWRWQVITIRAAALQTRFHSCLRWQSFTWEIGSIEVGKKADLVVLSDPKYEFLVYHTAKNLVCEVIKNGKTVYQKGEV